MWPSPSGITLFISFSYTPAHTVQARLRWVWVLLSTMYAFVVALVEYDVILNIRLLHVAFYSI
jgi:hypothetical protein